MMLPMSTVFLPPQFKATDTRWALTLMREHPLAQLISVDEQGAPFVTPLPLHIGQEAPDLVLLGHCSRGNSHWRLLQANPQAWVVFMGPQAYMSPAVYPDLARVPTWSYLTVHCKVVASLIDDVAAKDALLKQLIGDHEPAYAQQWRGLGQDYQHKMLAGIVGFELKVIELECKLKLNQHRPEAHEAMHRAYSQGSEQERALALWMRRLGLVSPDHTDGPAP